MLIVITTTNDPTEAETIAERLVSDRLAACVQILPPMTSVYVWEGRLHKESEYLLLIKTADENYEKVESLVSSMHSYDTPEIVAIEATRVYPAYVKWLGEMTD